jgi:exopolysaccharide production protein ExoQ
MPAAGCRDAMSVTDRLFIMLAGLVPPLAMVAPLGLTPLLIVVSIVMLCISGPRQIVAALPRWPLALAAAFLVWALLSTLWAIDPLRAASKAGQLAVLFGAGFVLMSATVRLSDPARAASEIALLGGVGGALALVALEILLGGPFSRLFVPPSADPIPLSKALAYYSRGATVVALCLVPAVVVLARRRGWLVAFAAALAGSSLLMLLNSRTAIVGALLGIVVAALALRWPRFVASSVAIVMAGMVFLMPVVPGVVLSDDARSTLMQEEGHRYQVLSLFHRLRIWEFTVARIEERPFLGWGLDSSRALPGGRADSGAGGEVMALHPHNAPLQVRVELGLPAVVLLAGLILWPIVRIWRNGSRAAAPILAVAAVAMAAASISYGLWQSWWVATLWLTAAFSGATHLSSARTP